MSSLYHTLMAPCGEAWVLCRNVYGDVFYSDDVHPNGLGQYMNACVFYATITGKSPIGLGDAGTGLGSTYNITKLQEFAWKAYTTYKDFMQPQCTPTNCTRLVEADGTVSQVPTTTAQPPTTTEPITAAFDKQLCDSPPSASANLLPSALISTDVATTLSNKIRKFCPAQWSLCYQSMRSVASPTDFHSSCGGRGPIIIIVQAGQTHFGAFTALNWSKTSQAPQRDLGAFVYRVNFARSTVNFQSIVTDAVSDYNMVDNAGVCPVIGVNADLNFTNCKDLLFKGYNQYTNLNPGYGCVQALLCCLFFLGWFFFVSHTFSCI